MGFSSCRFESGLRYRFYTVLGNKSLGVIGAGNMGMALVEGALSVSLVAPSRVLASCRTQARRDAVLSKHPEIRFVSNQELLASCDVVLLAVKPQCLKDVLAETRGCWREEHLVISVLAGVPTEALENGIGCELAVVRAMPNTPALIGEGMSAYCGGRFANADALKMAGRILRAVGKVVVVDESLMDPVTATSGSGPAYVFYLAENMMKAAETMGLNKDEAALLVTQTIFGAAKLLLEQGNAPDVLRRQVTSPGGTTAAAIDTLDKDDFSGIVQAALLAARDRAVELGAA